MLVAASVLLQDQLWNFSNTQQTTIMAAVIMAIRIICRRGFIKVSLFDENCVLG